MHGENSAHHHAWTQPGKGTLSGAVIATLGLVATELAGGYFGHSIALVSDAIHNLSDVPTLVISWLALRWAERPADSERTYGYHRTGILAAFTNAILLALVAVYLFAEAVERFRRPVAVHESWMIWVSLAALGVNGGITLALLGGRRDLNLRSVLVHNFGDALSNIGILVGALLIRATGALWLDPLLSVAIGGLILWSSVGILRESGHILLEGLPREMRLEDVARAILDVPGVQEVHDVHIWTLGTDRHLLSCHIRIPDMHMEESEKILANIRRQLAEQFRIDHVTVQFERAGLPRNTGYYMPETFRSSK